jgi:hypothetical protein
MVNDPRAATSVESVYAIINNSELIPDKKIMIDGFWDMFVIDALIANGDRHLGNWGILEKNDKVTLAPIYDCGSSLSALLDDNSMTGLLADMSLFKNQEFNKTSCYSMGGKRVFYHEVFMNPPKELANAIKRIVPRIDMEAIHSIVVGIPHMSDIRRNYLIKALDLRYGQILAPALKRVLRREKSQTNEPEKKPSILAQLEDNTQSIVEQEYAKPDLEKTKKAPKKDWSR